MSYPKFIPQKVAESANTTLLQIIRIINALMDQLNTIFTYINSRVQNDSVILPNVQLVVGTNQIKHTLGRALSGWQIVRMRNVEIIAWDTQDDNPNPKEYLQLVSNATGSCDILVF